MSAPAVVSPYPFEDQFVDPVSEDGSWSDEESGDELIDIDYNHETIGAGLNGANGGKITGGHSGEDPFAISPPCGNAPTPQTLSHESSDYVQVDSDDKCSGGNEEPKSWLTAPTPFAVPTPHPTPCPLPTTSRSIQRMVYSELLGELSEVNEADESASDLGSWVGEEEIGGDDYVEEDESEDESEEEDENDEDDSNDSHSRASADSDNLFPELTAALGAFNAAAVTEEASRGSEAERRRTNLIVVEQRIATDRARLAAERSDFEKHKRDHRARLSRVDDLEREWFPSMSCPAAVRAAATEAARQEGRRAETRKQAKAKATPTEHNPESAATPRLSPPRNTAGFATRGGGGFGVHPGVRNARRGSLDVRCTSSPEPITTPVTDTGASANYIVSLPPGSVVILPRAPHNTPVEPLTPEQTPGVRAAEWQAAVADLREAVKAIGIPDPLAHLEVAPAPGRADMTNQAGWHTTTAQPLLPEQVASGPRASEWQAALADLREGVMAIGFPDPHSSAPAAATAAAYMAAQAGSVASTVQLSPAPPQMVQPAAPAAVDGFDLLEPFDPAFPLLERAGWERVVGLEGDFRVPAHYNAGPNCTCAPCSVRRAADADADCTIALAAARMTHHLIVQTPMARTTAWRIFACRATGIRVDGRWGCFTSELPAHEPVILD